MSIHIITVAIAIDTTAVIGGQYQSYAVDCVNEVLRETQRSYNAESVILDYALGAVEPSPVPVADYAEGDAFTSSPVGIPTVVMEVDGGAIHCVRSTGPVRVIVLDDDTEGGDSDRIHEINGSDVYVTDKLLLTLAQPGGEGIAADFVADVVDQLPVTIEDLLRTTDRAALDSLLVRAAGEKYATHLPEAWGYWHYGRHAEFASELGMTDLAQLFSAAWQIEHRVHGEDAAAAELERQTIRSEYDSATPA